MLFYPNKIILMKRKRVVGSLVNTLISALGCKRNRYPKKSGLLKWIFRSWTKQKGKGEFCKIVIFRLEFLELLFRQWNLTEPLNFFPNFAKSQHLTSQNNTYHSVLLVCPSVISYNLYNLFDLITSIWKVRRLVIMILLLVGSICPCMKSGNERR